ncbi:MAG: YetF domain-containing protein [Streptosporangiales bacterium]
MWHSMFAEQIPAAEKIIRTVTVYALIALLFRVAGKRGMASMNTFDFVVIFLPTTVISDGHVIQRALVHLGLRRSELDHAVRLENGDDVSEVGRGVLAPGGQLVLTLKASEQGATKADVADLQGRLGRIEEPLAAR